MPLKYLTTEKGKAFRIYFQNNITEQIIHWEKADVKYVIDLFN
jgi:hypothetical protein